MNYIYDFLHQEVPESQTGMPEYYRRALIASEVMLGLNMLLSCVLLAWASHYWTVVPLLMTGGVALCVYMIDHLSARLNLELYALVIIVWCTWFIHTFGWNLGGQHSLLLILVLSFFNIYEPAWLKLMYVVLLLSFRIMLFYHALTQSSIPMLTSNRAILIQTFNSVTFFLNLSAICILLSTNMQDSERQLLLANQELHKLAGTDPLTQLPNRRAMMDTINQRLRAVPNAMYCVAIADIDFFKKINDTYGHHCGDYTLQTLAAVFRERAEAGGYQVCRWGGEEFCFFLPDMNIDTAGVEMNALRLDVSHMPLHFEEVDFSITITIGVGECDYRSPVETIINEADEKLYMGKNRGRNQVIA